jgi:hypothetical protein
MNLARVDIDELVQILDRLFELEVPRGSRSPRLVQSGDRDPGGVRLRAQLVRCGWDLWTIGGELALFDALRAIMVAQPHRQLWNRTVLSALWADIGVPERNSA